jgi:ornithine cyclodeaminase/alanine dehydrogenase-like protein (mu-crystallin family)
MLVVTPAQTHALAPMPRLIEALRDAFRTGCSAPVRQAASVPGGAGDRVILSMPAFDFDGSGVVKLVTVFPDNRDRLVPTVRAIVVVFSNTGEPVAILDGTSVTQLRTAAASALASTYLSRNDSAHLVIIGTGALAPYMAMAHCAVRPIRSIAVWGRRAERALATAATIRCMLGDDMEIMVSSSLEQALATADIVSCATTSVTPVLRGEWLQPGTLVDLVGGFSADRREADDTVVQRSRIFVDTLAGAMAEAGDILDPLARGVILREKIEGELADLVTGRTSGRVSRDEIIMFKSVGAAIEDLAAARLVIGAIRDGGYAGLPT